MTHSFHLHPEQLTRTVFQAAENADGEGYWRGDRPIRADVEEHLLRFLSVLIGGDDDLDPREMDIFEQVSATGSEHPMPLDELVPYVRDFSRLIDDPDALQAFLTTTPAYLRAIVEMDRERGTRNAEQVVTALGGLALAVLAADGKAEVEEDAIFTVHLDHLRGELQGDGSARAG